MTIPLTGAGGLMTKVGHTTGWLNDINSIRGGTATTNVLVGAQVPTRLAQAEVDYAGGTAEYTTIDGLGAQATAFQGTFSGFLQQLQTLEQSTVIDMANTDTPLASKTLPAAIQLLVQQMTGVASINANVVAVAAQTAVGTPTGNPIFVISKVDGSGRNLQYVFPETLTFAVTQDAQSGATAAQEPYSVTGQNAQSDMLAFDWLTSKYGSGVTQSYNLVDGAQSNAGGNVLVNSDFETFTTANVPDNWTLLVGAAGTDIFSGGAGNACRSNGGSLQFTGTGGAVLDAVTQTFNIASTTTVGAGGTPYVPLAGGVNNTQYCLNTYIKTSATPAAGVVEFALVDGSNVVINDDAGTANLATRTLTNISTTYVNFNTVFRLPQVVPSTVKLRVRLSTAIDSGKSVFFSLTSLTPMNQLYAGGPYVAGFSGSTKVNTSGAAPDSWTFAITLSTVGAFQKAFWRWFNPPSLVTAFPGIIIPNSGAPTINDNLVV